MLSKAQTHLKKDKQFLPLLAQVELSDFDASGKVYEELLESIVSQQLSVKAAATIFGRFIALFDGDLNPQKALAIPMDQLRSVGLSNSKANYIHNVSHFFIEYNLINKDRNSMTNEEIIKLLTQIK